LSGPAEPPQAYVDMLREVMSGHHGSADEDSDKPAVDEAKFARFVQAQITWDRAMAEALAVNRHPAAVTVGIAGSGHLRHGHGIAHQLADLGYASTTWLPLTPDDCEDIETSLAKEPNIILSLPLDPVTSAAAFKEARDNGVSLVFLSNLPSGYEHPRDYAAIVTDDLFQMGKQAADALASSMNGKGTVGWIYHDADYYVTNQRDNAFKTTIENDYPDISIVAEQGIGDPARAEEIANAMLLKNPDLGGIYVTWAGPAEGVLAALRANGNKSTKIVTLDLSEPVAVDMVRGGNVAAIVADEAYELGRAMAAAAALRLVGTDVPPFVVAPAITVTADTVAEGWKKSLNIDPPASVSSAN